MKTNKHLFAKRLIWNSLALCASDSLVLLAGLLLGDWIVFLIHGVPISMQYSLAVIPVWCLGAMAARVTPAWGIGPVEEFRRIQLLLLAVFGMAGIAVVLSRGMMPSRIVYLVSWLCGTCFIPLVRIPVKKLLLLFGVWGCSTAVYGRKEQVSAVIDDFIAFPLLGYVPQFVFTNDLPVGSSVKGVPVQGSVESFTEASVAVVPVALAEDFSVSNSFDRIFSSYRKVVLLPDIKEDIFLWAVPRTLGSLIGLEISSNLLNPFARLAKRAIDLLIVLCLIPAWVPLMAVLAGLIACVDRQNPFFIQRRVGRYNRPFHPLKFRTMVSNAEQVLEQRLSENLELQREWEKSCKLKEDPRVTRIGKLLRRTSLDELPQVINVLLGQMSLVGPRPLPDYHHDRLTEAARAPRARVRPGITGLWQISGRSDVGTAGMEKWDTYYVRNWSVWLDAVILARTFICVLRGKGAY